MRIIIKNLPYKITNEEIHKAFSEFGQITDIQIPQTLTGKPRRICFIGYATAESAQKATKMNNTLLSNMKICVQPVKDSKDFFAKKQRLLELSGITKTQKSLESATVLVKGIPYTCTEEEVKKHFKTYGDLKSVTLQKGSAVLEYKNTASSNKAYNECTLFMGRRIRIEEHTAKKEEHEYFNSLFFDFNTVVNKICEEEKIEKKELLNLKDSELGMRISALETHLVDQTKKFLEANNIFLDKLTGLRSKNTLLIRNYDLLDNLNVKAKIKVAPSRCVALLEFKSENEALKAYKELNLKRIKDKALYVEFLPLSEGEQKEDTTLWTDKLIIKNVPFQANKEEIKKLIETQVPVREIRMPIKRDGTHRGFCFLTLESAEASKIVAEYFGKSTHLYGRRLVILPAEH